MVYEVPPSKASIKQNRFEFKFRGNKKTYSLPKLQFLTPKLQSRLMAAVKDIPDGEEPTREQGAVIYDLQLAIFEHYIPDFLDLVDGQDQITALFEAWQGASKISLGESSASAGS